MTRKDPTRSLDNLRDMALFIAVANTGSVTRAAALVEVPKATLSRRIAALEQRLGVALLIRGGQRMSVTPEGEAYLAEAEELVRRAELLHDGMLADRSEPAGTVRINVAPDIAEHVVAPLLAKFQQRYPLVKVLLEQHPERVDLIERGSDIVVRVGRLPDSGLCARPLGELTRALLASPDYLAQAGTPQRPEDLAQHRCIRLTARSAGTETHWRLRSAGQDLTLLTPESVTTNTAGTAQALAEAGAGIALTILEFATRPIAEGRLLRILPAWSGYPFVVHAVTLTRRQPARVRLLLDYLAEHFAAQCKG